MTDLNPVLTKPYIPIYFLFTGSRDEQGVILFPLNSCFEFFLFGFQSLSSGDIDIWLL